MFMIDSRLLNPEDIAYTLGISKYSVREKLKSGEIKGFKLGKGSQGRWKIRQEEFIRYIEEREAQGNQDK